MASIFTLPRAVPINESGRPYPFAYAYFFLTGTETPATTYSDAELTAPHSHPIQADSAGVFPVVYLDEGVEYKFRLTKADGTLIQPDVDPASDGALTASQIDDLVVLLNPRTDAENAAGITPADYSVLSHDKCGYFMPERYALNTVPGTTVMQTGVQNAVLVAVQDGGGTVLLSDRYKMTAPLLGKAKVDIYGMGEGAALEFPVNVDGITCDWLTGFGSVTYDNFQLIGTTGGTGRAIYQAGTLNDADELYGLTLRNLLITHWNVGIKLRTVRNLEIVGNWIQYVDRGIELIGKCLVAYITRNKVVRAGGAGGGGASAAITLDAFNYSAGAGSVPPEGIQIFNNLLYSFESVLTVGTVNVCNFTHNDTQSSVYGVDLSTAQLGFNVTDNYFDMSGAAVVAGFYGRGLGAIPSSKINIVRNAFAIASGPVGAIGVKINDSGNSNQSFVTTDSNYFFGDWKGGDIVYNNANSGAILNNRCTSATPTSSISVPAVASGTVYVRDNLCTKALSFDAADAAAGRIVLGHNTVSGTTQQFGSQQVPTVASATAVTLPLGASVFLISGTTTITSIVATGWEGRRVTLIFQGSLTLTDGSNLKLAGSLSATADDAIDLVCAGGNWYQAAAAGVN